MALHNAYVEIFKWGGDFHIKVKEVYVLTDGYYVISFGNLCTILIDFDSYFSVHDFLIKATPLQALGSDLLD